MHLKSINLSGLKGQMLSASALRGAAAALSFALNWLIARQFGADGVGAFGLALSTAVFMATLALSGIDFILVRAVAVALREARTGLARGAVRRCLKRVALIALPMTTALAIGREWLAVEALNDPAVAPFLGVMAIVIPAVAATKLASSGLRATGHVVMSQAIDGPIGTGLAALAFGTAILAGAAGSPLLPAVIYAGFTALAALIGWLWLARAMRGWAIPEHFAEPLARTGIPILLVVISSLFVDWFAAFLLTSTGSVADAGVYRVAFQITATLNLLIVAADSILAPVIAASYSQGERARIGALSRKAVLAIVALGAPLLLVIAVAPAWLMGLFGDEFREGALALQILAVGQFVALLTGPVGTILTMTKHERWSMAYALVAVVVGAVLCWALIPSYGVLGAAIALTASTIIRRLAALLIVEQVIGIPFLRKASA